MRNMAAKALWSIGWCIYVAGLIPVYLIETNNVLYAIGSIRYIFEVYLLILCFVCGTLFIGFAEVIKLLEENNRILLKNYENEKTLTHHDITQDMSNISNMEDAISSQINHTNSNEIEKDSKDSDENIIQINQLPTRIDDNVTKRQLKILIIGVIAVVLIYLYFAFKFL